MFSSFRLEISSFLLVGILVLGLFYFMMQSHAFGLILIFLQSLWDSLAFSLFLMNLYTKQKFNLSLWELVMRF